MLAWFKRFLAAPVFAEDEEKTRVTSLLNTIVYMLFIIVLATSAILMAIEEGFLSNPNNWVVLGILIVTPLGLRALIHRGNVRFVSWLLSFMFWVSISFSIYTFGGIQSPDTAGYLLVIVMAGLLLGAWAAAAFAALSIAAIGAMWYAQVLGMLAEYPGSLVYNFTLYSIMFVITALLLRYAVNSISYALERARRNEQAQAESNLQLQHIRVSLEEIVAARTHDLERRSEQLRLASEVARDATAAHDLDELLNNAANQVRERFNFYHVSLFLVDETGEYAVLRAAAGQAGRQMLERGHKLQVGKGSIVGYAVDDGQPRIAFEGSASAVDFRDVYLPGTRSEMALPLRVGQRIVGALDVRSTQAEAFDQDDMQVFQTLADQLAVAIENARLIRALQQNLGEIEAVYGRYTRDAWSAFVRSAGVPLGYRYRHLDVEPATEQHPEAHEALQQGHSVTAVQAGAKDGEQVSAVAIPIKLRDQVIGVLDLRAENRPISPDAISLTEEAADRLALALENARLLEETQRRAERERLASQITARIRAASDVDGILRTTVQEVRRALGVSHGVIRLGTEAQSQAPGANGQAAEGDEGDER